MLCFRGKLLFVSFFFSTLILFTSSSDVITANEQIKIILDEKRNEIRNLSTTFQFPDNRTLAESDGQPIRSVVITSWRSGSTFFGQILDTNPLQFYHYEPLSDFGIVQVRDSPLAEKAISRIKKLLQCDYSEMDEYLLFGRENPFLFKKTKQLGKICHDFPAICQRSHFMEPYCKLFPMQSMKVVRLRLAIAGELFADTNVRIVLLVRDPRGTLQSRKHHPWCPGEKDCDHAPTLCQDLVSDYEAAQVLIKKFPNRFMVVRYEDLSLDPLRVSEEIFNLYGIPFDEAAKSFLEAKTISNPNHWLEDLEFEEVKEIQDGCTKAMSLWGYKMLANETMQNMSFDPLLDYSL